MEQCQKNDWQFQFAYTSPSSMSVVRRHNHIFCQPKEPITGLGSVEMTDNQLLTFTVKCTPRSSIVASNRMREAMINLADNEFFPVVVETIDSNACMQLKKHFEVYNINFFTLRGSDRLLAAEIHLPEFLKLCRNEFVLSIKPRNL